MLRNDYHLERFKFDTKTSVVTSSTDEGQKLNPLASISKLLSATMNPIYILFAGILCLILQAVFIFYPVSLCFINEQIQPQGISILNGCEIIDVVKDNSINWVRFRQVKDNTGHPIQCNEMLQPFSNGPEFNSLTTCWVYDYSINTKCSLSISLDQSIHSELFCGQLSKLFCYVEWILYGMVFAIITRLIRTL